MACTKPMAVYLRPYFSGLSSVNSGKSIRSGNNSFAARLERAQSVSQGKDFPAVGDGGRNFPPQGLSQRYESGAEGAGAIGYDRMGGTSYGTYQISSRQGTMDRFLSFLKTEAPDLAAKLLKAGPADTGGKSGRMPEVWRMIAAGEASRFEELQRRFIEETHYRPALEMIRETTGLDVEEGSMALQEVLWSASVQHGPAGAARIFKKAVKALDFGVKEPSDAAIVSRVYSERVRCFGGSSSRVRAAVAARLSQERGEALAMLAGHRGISATA